MQEADTRNALPCPLRVERFARPHLDRPVRYRDAHPVKACACDFGKVLLGLRAQASVNCDRDRRIASTDNERRIVLLERIKVAVLGHHGGGQVMLVHASRVGLEDGRRDEGFQCEPSGDGLSQARARDRRKYAMVAHPPTLTLSRARQPRKDKTGIPRELTP